MITFYDHFPFINTHEPSEALLRQNSPIPGRFGPAFRSL